MSGLTRGLAEVDVKFLFSKLTRSDRQVDIFFVGSFATVVQPAPNLMASVATRKSGWVLSVLLGVQSRHLMV